MAAKDQKTQYPAYALKSDDGKTSSTILFHGNTWREKPRGPISKNLPML